MNIITDSTFKNIKDSISVFNNDLVISKDEIVLDTWRVKTKDGACNAICTKVSTGLKIDAYYPSLGYIYIREIVSGIRNLEGKTYTLKITMSRDSWQPLNYDVYVAARYSSNDLNRVTLLDTTDAPLNLGTNIIEVEFTCGTELNRILDAVNGLDIAFRLIGNNQNTSCTINSIELHEKV